jgi:predicted MPP superfamily phosphohydrolase
LKRRNYLGLVGTGALAFGTDFYMSNRQEELDNPLGLPSERLEEDDFWTIAVMPDTQNYASNEEWIHHLEDQVEWIVDSQDEYNIVFATHEGDMVNNGADQEQWGRIESALEPLHGEVPYSISPGNHDWETTYDKSSGIDQYQERFGHKRFEDKEWYEGTGPNGLSHAQVFSTGEEDFLHLGLEWEPRDETLEWADQKIDEHSLPTIITTHSHLHKGVFDKGRFDDVKEENGYGNHGEQVFNNLVSPNSEIFMVLSGHSFGGILPRNAGEYRQVSKNQENEPVYEMLADFQDRKNGGNGWMRNITFLPDRNDGNYSIDVSTYSPSEDMNQVGEPSIFSYQLDFSDRFNR